MRRIANILASLIVALALSPVFAAEQPQFTPEQHEVASGVLSELGSELYISLSMWFGSHDAAHAELMDLDAQWQEGAEEIRQMLRVDLLFARKVCGLTDAEYQALTQASEAAMKERVLPLMLAEQEPDESDEPPVEESMLPQMAQAAVSQAAECLLTPQQFETFVAELRTRTAHRKRVTIQNLVVRLDTDLHLSPNQREKFAQLFETHWQESWSQSLSALTSEFAFMPTLPEDKVFSILSAVQQETFKTHSYADSAYGWDLDPLGLFVEQGVAGMIEEADEVTLEPGNKPNDKQSDD